MLEAPHRDPALIALTRQVAEAGLFDKRPAFYLRKLAQAALLALASVALMGLTSSLPLQLVAAVLLAVAFTQVGYTGHDAGHHQVLRQRRHNDWLGLFLVNFVMGFSYGWWVEKHNRHHEHPNDLEHDPDVRFEWVVFDEQQLTARRTAFQKFFVRHQAWLFFPLLAFLAYSLRWDSAQYLRQPGVRRRGAEVALIGAHGLWFGAVVFGLLGAGPGLLFCLVHQAALGIFLGSAFAANHKGMPIVDGSQGGSELWRQVVTTRNLRAHPLTDYWYGGLTCQIEHHLFPMMPQHHLRAAADHVRRFCVQRGVPYHEAGVAQSYKEILQHLHSVSAPLRLTPTEKEQSPHGDPG